MRQNVLMALVSFTSALLGAYVGTAFEGRSQTVSVGENAISLPDDDEVALALSRLNSRLNRLELASRRGISESTSSVSGPSVAVGPASVAVAAPTPSEVPDSEGHADATEKQGEDVVNSKLAAFSTEVRDDRWADGVESQSLSVIAGWAGVTPKQVECRSSTCFLDLEFEDDAAVNQIDFTQLSATTPARVTTNEERDGQGRITRWRVVSKVSYRSAAVTQ